MKKLSIGLSFLLAMATFLTACNLPRGTATPTPDANYVFTAAALTVQAKINENTPIPPLPTVMPPEIATLDIPPTAFVSTNTPAPIVNPTATATSLPCDAAGFVDDVTIPDDTSFAPGTTFTKTWRIKNTGSCTWTSSYALVFDSGTSMNAPASIALTGNVAPGQTVDLSVDLKAPDTANTYKGNWKLRNASGVIFGIGNDNKPFWVQIKVAVPTSQLFAVTSVSFTINPSSYDGTCPTEITLAGKIKVSKAGDVVYTYRREDGYASSPMTISFSEAGEKTLSDFKMSIGTGPGFNWTGKIWLRIDEPNHQDFNQVSFTINCQ
jgi:hypothetical protein